MQDISAGLREAVRLLLSLDEETYQIIFLSLQVSGTAVLLASLMGIPLGALINLKNFWGKKLALNIMNTFMGLPPVVIGLVVYLFLSSSGPLGELELLFTPGAMIIAQTMLVTPIVAGLTVAALSGVNKMIGLTAASLGANSWQIAWAIIKEARYGVMAAVVSGFGRAIAEVGAVIMVGGDIQGNTRVMTTAIALQTRMGNFSTALALGIILLFLSFLINLSLNYLAERRGR